MASSTSLRTYDAPEGISVNQDFNVEVRPLNDEGLFKWSQISAYAADVSSINTSSSVFDNHVISVASLDVQGAIQIKAKYTAGSIEKASVRPVSYGIEATIEDASTVMFTMNKPRDVILEINGDKWKALHFLTNEIDSNAPTGDSEGIWYFGPGINNGPASSRIKDGNLNVPSGITVYLSGGAFLNARVNFINVSNSGIRGHGFIHRGNNGAILMERASNILVENVTSLSATGFSLTTGETKGVHINGYRSFSSHGNGDGLDFFCSSGILVENCFLRNSDDTIALYSHRWGYYGDTHNITIRDCVLLPDIAHPISIGTHGNPPKPETISGITISNIDILDHEENQTWYQGCIAINVGDENLVDNVHVEDVRVERITRGQLVNLRVMQNARWTTAPGRGIRNVTFKNLQLNMENSKIVNPSQILGYDGTRNIENVTFEDLRIGNRVIHDGMAMPRWYMVTDFVPMLANEHVKNLRFTRS